jgi:hypothetical protein
LERPVADLHFRRLKEDGRSVSVIEALALNAEGLRIVLRPGDATDRVQGGPGYFLQQNAPNPFNPETQISYAISMAGRVRLIVYNMLGQAVRTLVDEGQAAGRHVARWDGRDDTGRTLASGVYIYRIEADNFKAVRRMMLLK